MIASSNLKHQIFNTIRSSWTYLGKKGFGVEPKSGFYGKSFDHSIKRLADKLDANVGIVRMHVMKLISDGVVEFVKNRLVALKDKVAAFDRKVKMTRPNLTVVPELADISSGKVDDIGLPPEKSYLYGAWSDLFTAQPAAV